MWAQVNAASVHQANVVQLMQIDMLLGVQMTQIDNISLQTTLMLGFALGMWAGETLDPLLSDEDVHCVFKPASFVFGVLFFIFVAVCISVCVICVTISSYVKQTAQEAALIVSTAAAVAKTRQHLQFIFLLFHIAMVVFILSAVLLIWMFAGLPNRIRFQPDGDDAVESESEFITELDDGSYVIACIDINSAAANRRRDQMQLSIGCANTIVIFLFTVYGFVRYRQIVRSYNAEELIPWYAEHQATRKKQTDVVAALTTKAARGVSYSEINTSRLTTT